MALNKLRDKLIEEASKQQFKPNQIKCIEDLIAQAERIKSDASLLRLNELTTIITWANDLLYDKAPSPQTLDLLSKELSRSSFTDDKSWRIFLNILGVVFLICSVALCALGIAIALLSGGDGTAIIAAGPMLLGIGGIYSAVHMLNAKPQSVVREIKRIGSVFFSPEASKEESIESQDNSDANFINLFFYIDSP